MVAQSDAVNWLNSVVGQKLDFDKLYGLQCVDMFNFYYQFCTGDSPYADGYSVPGAKDLWNVANDLFTKIPDSSTLVPQPGDVAVYGAAWGAGFGHVEMVVETDANGCWFVGENEHNNPNEGVVRVYRTWLQMRGLIGVMRPNWYTPPPEPPVPVPMVEPIPAPEPPVAIPYVPPAPPKPVKASERYLLVTTMLTFNTDMDALSGQAAAGTVAPWPGPDGKGYYVFSKNGNAYNLTTDNMKDQTCWVNILDNKLAPPAVVEAVVPTPEPDWKATFKPFIDGKSRRYKALRDMFILDYAGVDPKGINIRLGELIPIFGTFELNGILYLLPRLNDAEGKPIMDRYYGIPTNSVYTGLPNMESVSYRINLDQAQVDNRAYRRSVHHETTDDKIFYAEQLIKRAVGDGIRFVSDVIPLKKLKALYSQKETKK